MQTAFTTCATKFTGFSHLQRIPPEGHTNCFHWMSSTGHDLSHRHTSPCPLYRSDCIQHSGTMDTSLTQDFSHDGQNPQSLHTELQETTGPQAGRHQSTLITTLFQSTTGTTSIHKGQTNHHHTKTISEDTISQHTCPKGPSYQHHKDNLSADNLSTASTPIQKGQTNHHKDNVSADNLSTTSTPIQKGQTNHHKDNFCRPNLSTAPLQFKKGRRTITTKTFSADTTTSRHMPQSPPSQIAFIHHRLQPIFPSNNSILPDRHGTAHEEQFP
eukprot:TRINITY_DN49679_c0_g1_i7.p1 TRINITY_DN49679_c0_g1~~TRINITY_DN49679_c0_g1_i7.p1  ORF type:complete len:271 (-),score=46.83 TRINITY_DN49679_c0_g1_i7:267-1079(-)